MSPCDMELLNQVRMTSPCQRLLILCIHNVYGPVALRIALYEKRVDDIEDPVLRNGSAYRKPNGMLFDQISLIQFRHRPVDRFLTNRVDDDRHERLSAGNTNRLASVGPNLFSIIDLLGKVRGTKLREQVAEYCAGGAPNEGLTTTL